MGSTTRNFLVVEYLQKLVPRRFVHDRKKSGGWVVMKKRFDERNMMDRFVISV